MKRSRIQERELKFNVLVGGRIFAAFVQLVDAEDFAYGLHAGDENLLIEIEHNKNFSKINDDVILKLKPRGS